MSGITVGVHAIEDRANEVEIAIEARPRVDYEKSDAIADVDLERIVLVLERATVEHDVTRLLCHCRLPVRLHRGHHRALELPAVARLRVELALHEDELFVGG